jgi:hypothetical protein
MAQRVSMNPLDEFQRVPSTIVHLVLMVLYYHCQVQVTKVHDVPIAINIAMADEASPIEV